MNWVRKIKTEFECDSNVYCHRLYGKRRGVIAFNIRNGKVAYSWCHPDDKWDMGIGVSIAYARLKHLPIPEMEDLPTIEECVGKWVETLNYGTIVYVTPIRSAVEMLTLTRYGDKMYLDKRFKCKIIQ